MLTSLANSTALLLGDFSLFVFDTLRSSRFIWRRRGFFLRQCEFIGVNSILIIAVAGCFMGAVLGYQLYVSLHRLGSESLLGGTVGVALFRELAPVMTGIMVTGRAGAAMAAEISSMKISEQVDALEVMAVDPIELLVFPRVLAGFLTMPILALMFTAVASVAASVVACGILDLQYTIYWRHYLLVVDPIEIFHCVVKSASFGLVLTWIGCFCGLRAYGGALAVGQATRTTVVATCLSILLSDYLLTAILPLGFKTLEVM
jgi:phospholipid/cholesterol/gamma-HCH transport system permease protein